MSERESKPDEIQDLDKPVSDNAADAVKGGMTQAPSTTTSIPIRVLPPKTIIPCV